MASTPDQPERKHPAHGVLIKTLGSTIVFVTVCTKDRKPWLATDLVHRSLREVWTIATAWQVGRCVIMPDHIHLFAGYTGSSIPLDNWVRYWKSQFSKMHRRDDLKWQSDHWDTRMRDADRYEEKWRYVRNNPVRHGLVANADDWPYQGEVFQLSW